MAETEIGEILDADDLFPQLQEIKARMEFPCAICGTSFGSHNMEILTNCFQQMGRAQSTLARKLIEAVDAISTHAGELDVHSNTLRRKSAPEMKEDVLAALRNTCEKLGVDVNG